MCKMSLLNHPIALAGLEPVVAIFVFTGLVNTPTTRQHLRNSKWLPHSKLQDTQHVLAGALGAVGRPR